MWMETRMCTLKTRIFESFSTLNNKYDLSSMSQLQYLQPQHLLTSQFGPVAFSALETPNLLQVIIKYYANETCNYTL